MIRLFLGSAGLGLCFKLFLKSDDMLTQALSLMLVPIFSVYIFKAMEKIKQEDKK